jgi:hypothetical protein
VPVDWPGGVRHGGGASLICGFRVERGKACPDTAPLLQRREREFFKRLNRKKQSTDAGHVGGPAHSSAEASVMEVERRGREAYSQASSNLTHPEFVGGVWPLPTIVNKSDG